MALLEGPAHVFTLANPGLSAADRRRATSSGATGRRRAAGGGGARLRRLARPGLRQRRAVSRSGPSRRVADSARGREAPETRYLDFVYQPIKGKARAGHRHLRRGRGRDGCGAGLGGVARERGAVPRRSPRRSPITSGRLEPDGQLDWFNDQVYLYNGVTPGSNMTATNGPRWCIPTTCARDRRALGARRCATGEVYENEVPAAAGATASIAGISPGPMAIRDTSRPDQPLGRRQHRHPGSEGRRRGARQRQFATLEARVAERIAPTRRDRGGVAPIAEDGGGRPTHRRHRPRFQQPAPGGRRARSTGCASGSPRGDWTDVERFLKAAEDGASRAAALTHRLLAFSRRQTLDSQNPPTSTVSSPTWRS